MLAALKAARRQKLSSDPKDVRDALISIECVSGSVKVSETVRGGNVQTRTALQEADVVSELQEKYIFYANEAEIARKLIERGRSFALSVYFREP